MQFFLKIKLLIPSKHQKYFYSEAAFLNPKKRLQKCCGVKYKGDLVKNNNISYNIEASGSFNCENRIIAQNLRG